MFNQKHMAKIEHAFAETNEMPAFRKNADDCHFRSQHAADRATKAEWLDLATQWHWLANQAAMQNGMPASKA
jgi:hypothetical protein